MPGDSAGIAAGDRAGETLGKTEGLNIMKGAFHQRNEGSSSLIRRRAKGLPEVGGHFNESNHIITGENGGGVIGRLIPGIEFNPMTIQVFGEGDKRLEERLFSFDSEGRAGNVLYCLGDAGEGLKRMESADFSSELTSGF